MFDFIRSFVDGVGTLNEEQSRALDLMNSGRNVFVQVVLVLAKAF